jgi:hypothetical protein
MSSFYIYTDPIQHQPQIQPQAAQSQPTVRFGRHILGRDQPQPQPNLQHLHQERTPLRDITNRIRA